MYTYQEVDSAIENETLTDALYKLERYAGANGISDLEEWCHKELHGYLPQQVTPEIRAYRIVFIEWLDGFGRPLDFPPEYVESFSTMEFLKPLSDIEAYVQVGLEVTSAHHLQAINQVAAGRARTATVSAEQVQKLLKAVRTIARRRFHDAVPRRLDRPTAYPVPDFAALVPDAALAGVLMRRWHEANECFATGAYLSTVIMLGSILEGVLLSNVEQDKPTAFRAAACPKVRNTTTPLPLDEWKLSALIDVCKECGWLRADASQFSHTLREYRNFVHPNKEREEGVTFDKPIAKVAWEVISLALGV